MKVEEAPAAILLAKTHVSFRSRIGHLALLLVAAGASVALASLLATEQGLPARTLLALATLLAINLAWGIYAAWVLAARRTLLFNHRVVAGSIALTAAAMFALGAAALAVASGAAAAWLAAALGAVMVAVATALLLRARRDLRALKLRRAELEALLSDTGR